MKKGLFFPGNKHACYHDINRGKNMALSSSSNRIASLIGNLLEHYDSALFALAAPFIAPLFFHGKDPLTALILTYGMLPLGLIAKPLGSLFFGWIGDQFSYKKALFYSLLGTAVITVGMGLLPTYQTIGNLAPLLLALSRMLQSFFVAGESVGGALVLLEETQKTKRSLFSSFYNTSSMGGIILASVGVGLTSLYGSMEEHWRILFLAGGVTAVLGLFIRYKAKESPKEAIQDSPSITTILRRYRKELLLIILASGFSHVTYSLSFTFINAFTPIVTTLTRDAAIALNTKLLIIDMLLLPCFGFLAHKIGKEKVMLGGALSCALLGVPLFTLLPNSSLYTITLIRLCIISGGVAFAAPYYAWAAENLPSKHRYLILGLGSSLGSQLIGSPCTSICLWLYKATKKAYTPGLYLMVVGLGASFSVYYYLVKRKPILASRL